jgi:hypothetical protein
MIINENNESKKTAYEKAPWPEELLGGWVCFTLLENHPFLGGMSSCYFNDKYPSGTIVVSNYIDDAYPDIYATWNHDCTSSRMFVSPKLRKSGKGKAALIVGDQLINKFFKNELQYAFGQNENGDFFLNGTYGLDKNIKDKVVDDLAMFDFRDPAYPVVNFDKRFIKYED